MITKTPLPSLFKRGSVEENKTISRQKELLNEVIDDKGFYALSTRLQNKLIKLRQGKCNCCKCK